MELLLLEVAGACEQSEDIRVAGGMELLEIGIVAKPRGEHWEGCCCWW